MNDNNLFFKVGALEYVGELECDEGYKCFLCCKKKRYGLYVDFICNLMYCEDCFNRFYKGEVILSECKYRYHLGIGFINDLNYTNYSNYDNIRETYYRIVMFFLSNGDSDND